jgi:hypothetical protein
MPPHPDAVRSIEPREDWKRAVDDDTALRRTLQLVIDAVRQR